jgi:hypothetical protein
MTKQSIKKFAFSLNDEAGDVPGWVLITLMTAGIVVVLWSLAAPAMSSLFENAMSKVATF